MAIASGHRVSVHLTLSIDSGLFQIQIQFCKDFYSVFCIEHNTNEIQSYFCFGSVREFV